jgi:hypothetical protein
MNRSTLERLAPLTGLVFGPLLIAVLAMTNNSPEPDDSTAKVVHYWSTHDTRETVAGALGGIAVLFFVWFTGTLRAVFRRAEGETGRVSGIFYGGALVFAVGGAIASSLELITADTVGDVPAAVTQTLSVLSAGVLVVLVAGVLTFQLAAAVLTFRFGALPRWVGYFSLLIAIVSVTPVFFFGFALTIIWAIIVSVVVYRAQEPAAASPAVAPPTA